MNGCRLSLELDEDDHEVWLITESPNGKEHRDNVRLRESFNLDDVRGAVLATGWVSQDGDELRFTKAFDNRPFDRTLSDLVEDMFSYFNSPDDLTDELLEVQLAVTEYEGMGEPRLDIPPYAYAWLDIMLREDIADEARSSKNIWAKSEVTIELDRSRAHWIEELLSRYSRPASRAISRMAGSLPTTKPDATRDTKTG